MSEFSRMERIEELVQRELAQLVLRELSFPKGCLVTLSRVSISKDLAHAKIWISVFPETSVADQVKKLNDASGFLRGLLAKRVKFRKLPDLRFLYDEQLAKANRLTNLIEQVAKPDEDSDQP